MRTINNGVSWQSIAPFSEGSIQHIISCNEDFWLLIDNSIYKSRDKGESWELEAITDANQKFMSLVKLSNGIFGWTVGEDGFAAKYQNMLNDPILTIQPSTLLFDATTSVMTLDIKNEGISPLTWSASSTEAWISSISPESGTNNAKVSVAINREGLDVGRYVGNVTISSNNESKDVVLELTVPDTSWGIQASGSANNLYDCCPVSELVSWAAGERGTILRTTNSTVWKDVWRENDWDAFCVEAISADTALAAFVDGVWHGAPNTAYIYRTTDGGAHWIKVFEQQNTFINDITMFSPAHGIAIGDPVDGSWIILETNDGGSSWNPIPNPVSAYKSERSFYSSVCWLNENKGWFGTNFKRIFYTNDGGKNWNTIDTPTLQNVSSIAINQSGICLAADTHGSMIRTIDNGVYWQQIAQPKEGSIHYIFAQQDTFWSIIDSDIFKSTDNGTTWELKTTAPSQLKNLSLKNFENGIFGLAVGMNGSIFQFSKKYVETQISHTQNSIPKQFALWQNYPNPFNPTTTISFSLPTASHVILEVFNTNGQQIAILANNNFAVGTHQISWDATCFSSGLYFYSISVHDISNNKPILKSTKKLIVLK